MSTFLDVVLEVFEGAHQFIADKAVGGQFHLELLLQVPIVL